MKQFVKKEESSERELISTADARALQALSLSGPGVGGAAQPYPDVPCRYTINNSTDPLSLNWSITRGTAPTSVGSKTVDITWQNVSTGNIYVTGMIGTNLGQVDQRIFINMLDYAAPNFMSAVKQSSAPDVYRHTFSFLYKNTNLKSKWTLPAGCVTTDGKSGTFEINQQVDKNGYLYIDLKNTRLTVSGNITMQAQMPNGLYSQVSTSQYNVTDVSFVDLSAPTFFTSTKLSSKPDTFRYTFSDNTTVSQYEWSLPRGCVTTANESGTFTKAKQVTGGKMYIDLKNVFVETIGTIYVKGVLPQEKYTQVGTANYDNTDMSLANLSAPKFLGLTALPDDPNVFRYTFSDNPGVSKYKWILPKGCCTTEFESGTFTKEKRVTGGKMYIDLKNNLFNAKGDIVVQGIVSESQAQYTSVTTTFYENTDIEAIVPTYIPNPIDVCNSNTYRYTVAKGEGVSYRWVVPEGSNIISGQGTNEIIIKPGNHYLFFALQVYITYKGKSTSKIMLSIVRDYNSIEIVGEDEPKHGSETEYTLSKNINNTTVVEWSLDEAHGFEIKSDNNSKITIASDPMIRYPFCTITAKIKEVFSSSTTVLVTTISKSISAF